MGKRAPFEIIFMVFTPPSLSNTRRWNGLRVGLLGGSFNPPHEGHVHISIAALQGLNLDFVWWLVTPQNPLKTQRPSSIDKRMAASRDIITHPRILVTDIEKELQTNITYQSVKKIKKHFPKTEFVWISGIDNALGLHNWNNWKELLAEIPMLHLSRGPASKMVRNCPLKMYEKQKHVHVDTPIRPDLVAGTTYWMMQKKMVHVSSTQLRNAGKVA